METSNLDALTRDALDYYLFPLASKAEIRSQGPMIFTSAEGMEITDAAGKTYLDMMSCHTRAGSLGYGQERIARAIYDQLMALHYAGTFANVVDVTVHLSTKMAALSPGSLTATLYGGSGSEANEMSIKLAKQYHIAKGDKPHAHKIISRWNAYHGATMGVIGSTDYLGTRAITEPGVPGFSRIPAPNLYRTPFGMDPSEVCDFCVDFLEEHIIHEGPETVAAFIAEPVMQGDGVQGAARRLLRQGARGLRQVRRAADRRRGDYGLRPHRALVRAGALGRGMRHHEHGEGDHRRLLPARRVHREP